MRHIAIEGNIGSGKTTLALQLAASLNASLLLEEFADNSFLPRFYEDPARYAFPLELSFLADRYRQVKGRMTGDLFTDTVVSDYIFIKSRIFSRINLDEEEYRLYCRLYDIMAADVPQPDVLIFLHAPVPVLLQRIVGRGRTYEAGISANYLTRVSAIYESFLRECNLPVLYIDSTSVDFAGDANAFDTLKIALKEPLTTGIRHLTFP